jgi:hypothetical protein
MPSPVPDVSLSRSRRGLVLAAVVLPTLLTLIVGLTHPAYLAASTAEWWRNLHIILLPVFPMIGAAPWIVSRSTAPPLAGIAAGSAQLAGHPETKSSLYAIANVFGPIGAIGLAVGWAAATLGVMRGSGLMALPGALAVVGALLVLRSHVYFPIGTLGLVLLIVGALVLALAPPRKPAS